MKITKELKNMKAREQFFKPHSCFNPVLYTGKGHSQMGRLVYNECRLKLDMKGKKEQNLERKNGKFAVPTARSYIKDMSMTRW